MTVFAKIIAKEIPADVVYEDDRCLAFRDINPQAPVHVLVTPKKPIESAATVADADVGLIGHLWTVIRDVAEKEGLGNGYRVVTNIGADGGQEVPHLHFHVLGGRAMTWPPG